MHFAGARLEARLGACMCAGRGWGGDYCNQIELPRVLRSSAAQQSAQRRRGRRAPAADSAIAAIAACYQPLGQQWAGSANQRTRRCTPWGGAGLPLPAGRRPCVPGDAPHCRRNLIQARNGASG